MIEVESRNTWDPLNFAFTALLGCLGFIVAALALGQALLAAGPGRVKASKTALGPIFSRSAKTRFDWTELRVRTHVSVPELDVDQVLNKRQSMRYEFADDASEEQLRPSRRGANQDSVLSSGEQSEYVERVCITDEHRVHAGKKLWDTFRYRVLNWLASTRRWRRRVGRLASRRHYGSKVEAGWVDLLDVNRIARLKWRTTRMSTDNLPSDVFAAPALATMEFLALIGLIQGGRMESSGRNHRLSFMKAKDWQMVIREHVILGQVAQIHYTGSSSRSRRSSMYWSDTRSALSEARGNFFYKSLPLVSFDFGNGPFQARPKVTELEATIDANFRGCSHQRCYVRNQSVVSWRDFEAKFGSYDLDLAYILLFADGPGSVAVYPHSKINFRDAIWPSLRKWQHDWDDNRSIYGAFRDACSDDSALHVFSADPDDKYISMDKRGSDLEEKHLRQRTDKSGWRWLLRFEFEHGSMTRSTWFEDDSAPDRPPMHGEFLLDPSETFVGSKRVVGKYNLYPTDGDLLVNASVLDDTIDYADPGFERPDISDEERIDKRHWYAWQLSQIDWWLRHHGGHSALCSALNLISTIADVRQRRLNDGRPDGVSEDRRVGKQSRKPTIEPEGPSRQSTKEDFSRALVVRRPNDVPYRRHSIPRATAEVDDYEKTEDTKPQSSSNQEAEINHSAEPDPILEERRQTSSPEPKNPDTEETGIMSLENQKLDALEHILVFRMLVYAMLIETATDSSSALLMGEKDRYIYVL